MIHGSNSGHPRFIGNYSYKEDHCLNFLRIYPSEGISEHLSEIISGTYYGPQQDWDPFILAPNPPDTIPGTVATEEDGTDNGINDLFFATPEYPPLVWVQQISWRFPTLEVVFDYQRDSCEYLGRVWFSGGNIYKQSHLTLPPAVEIIEHRNSLPASARKIHGAADVTPSRSHLSVVQGFKVIGD